MATTEQERKVFLSSNCDPNLAFIFAEVELPLEWQYKLVQAGYKNISRFIGLEESRAGVKEVLKSDFSLDPSSSTENRLTAAIIVSAWESAKDQASVDHATRATANVNHLPRPISVGDKAAMRKAAEKIHGTRLH